LTVPGAWGLRQSARPQSIEQGKELIAWFSNYNVESAVVENGFELGLPVEGAFND
jgi:hypothetical protein